MSCALICRPVSGFVDHHRCQALWRDIKRKSKWRLGVVRITWTVIEEKQIRWSKNFAMKKQVLEVKAFIWLLKSLVPFPPRDFVSPSMKFYTLTRWIGGRAKTSYPAWEILGNLYYLVWDMVQEVCLCKRRDSRLPTFKNSKINAKIEEKYKRYIREMERDIIQHTLSYISL